MKVPARPDLDLPELPAPDEKLLRAPTFFEKYGRVRLAIFVAILVVIIDCFIYFFLIKPDPTPLFPSFSPTPVPTVSPVPSTAVQNNQPQVACTMDAKQCPDGTWVGRSGPKCEFAACK